MPRAKLDVASPNPGQEPVPAAGAADGVRRRRRASDVRVLILDAARKLFAERGYARTTTRAIAEEAGASEVLLFRYFQSKADLFREAVAEPFDGLLRDFNRTYAGTALQNTERRARDYVGELFDFLSKDRGLVLALIANRTFGDDADDESLPGLPAYFGDATRFLGQIYEAAGLEPTLDPAFGARTAFACVVASALFQDWLFKDLGGPEEVREAVGRFVAYGLFGNLPPRR